MGIDEKGIEQMPITKKPTNMDEINRLYREQAFTMLQGLRYKKAKNGEYSVCVVANEIEKRIIVIE